MSVHATAVPEMYESGTLLHDAPLLSEYSRYSPEINGADSVALMVSPLSSAVMKSLALKPESLEIESIEMVVDKRRGGDGEGIGEGLGLGVGLGDGLGDGEGVVVSTTRALLLARESLPSRAGSVRAALLPAASLMVPPLRVKEEVAL